MQAHELGYEFYPFPSAKRVGYARLEVNLLRAPTFEHYDPEEMVAPVMFAKDKVVGIERLRIQHPWHGLERYRAAPGRVVLTDRRGKEVEAFTFGGELEIESSSAHTRCLLTSPVPILNLVNMQDTDGLLAQEVEILLAERRALWLEKPDTFEERLLALEPQELYAACLASLRQKFAHYPYQDDQAMHGLINALRSEANFVGEHSRPLAALV
jgi:hypothetical protein